MAFYNADCHKPTHLLTNLRQAFFGHRRIISNHHIGNICKKDTWLLDFSGFGYIFIVCIYESMPVLFWIIFLIFTSFPQQLSTPWPPPSHNATAIYAGGPPNFHEGWQRNTANAFLTLGTKSLNRVLLLVLNFLGVILGCSGHTW